MQQV
jgi:magnesium chelatase family protein